MLVLYVTSGLILGITLFDYMGSEALSSCHAFCGSADDPLACIESHCKAMYKQRVSRFGKRSGQTAGSSCSAICNANFSEDEEKCTRCRAILRQRINRFGKKRSPLYVPMLNYFQSKQANGYDDDLDFQYDTEDVLNGLRSLKRLLNKV